MTKTSIEWADEVWNPVTGCNKVSQGCKHCYAETIANRFWATQYPPNEDGSPRKFTDVRVHPERLDDPLKWRKPRRVFVNSMSDLFHDDVPDSFIADVWFAMMQANKHTYMILTKRARRMAEVVQSLYPGESQPHANCRHIWLGVSVEDQATADERIPLLLQTPAAVRFVSYEPALGPVDLNKKELICEAWSRGGYTIGTYLDWVIMGGESGPGARPMHPDWARSVRDQCQAAGVPFFLKQMYVNGELAKMPELDGKVWDEFPEAK